MYHRCFEGPFEGMRRSCSMYIVGMAWHGMGLLHMGFFNLPQHRSAKKDLRSFLFAPSRLGKLIFVTATRFAWRHADCPFPFRVYICMFVFSGCSQEEYEVFGARLNPRANPEPEDTKLK